MAVVHDQAARTGALSEGEEVGVVLVTDQHCPDRLGTIQGDNRIRSDVGGEGGYACTGTWH